MSKVTINTVGSIQQNPTSATTTINTNFNRIQTALGNTLSRDGTTPNQMAASLDMNSNRILNLPAPATSDEPVRSADINTLLANLNVGGSIGLPTGGIQGQVLAKLSSVNYATAWQNPSLANLKLFNVLDYGATGGGAVDDTVAIQACIDAAEAAVVGGFSPTVYFPTGIYLISNQGSGYGVKITKPINLKGEGKIASTFISAAGAYSYIQFDTTATTMYYINIVGLGFICADGTRPQDTAIEIKGSNLAPYWTIRDIAFYGTYYGINTANLNAGIGALMFWIRMTECLAINYGGNQVHVFWNDPKSAIASGLFSDCVIICDGNGFLYGDGTNGIGDTMWCHIQFGGVCTAFKFVGKQNVYGTNFIITNCHFDAGVALGIDFTDCNNFQIKECTWPGAGGLGGSAYTLTRCFDYIIDGTAGNQPGSGGSYMTRSITQSGIQYSSTEFIKDEWVFNNKDSLGINPTTSLFSVTLNTAETTYVKLITTGFAQGNSQSIAITEYILQRGTSGAAVVTQISNNVAGGFTHSTSISNGVVTFSCVAVASSAGTDMNSKIQVVGKHELVSRL